MKRGIKKDESYLGKLVKMLPAESVALYIAVMTAIPSDQSDNVALIVKLAALGVITILTPFFLIKIGEMKLKENLLQIIFITLSFIVWVFAKEGEDIIKVLENYPYIKTVGLILWTAIIPLIMKGKEEST